MTSKADLLYEVSEKAFADEKERTKTLEDKADKYIVAVGLIIGFQLTGMANIVLAGQGLKVLAGWVAVLSYLALAAALLIALRSRAIQKFSSYADGQTLVDALRDPSLSDEDAKIRVAKMYLDARRNNISVNNRKAHNLTWSGGLITAGFFLAVLSYVISRLA